MSALIDYLPAWLVPLVVGLIFWWARRDKGAKVVISETPKQDVKEIIEVVTAPTPELPPVSVPEKKPALSSDTVTVADRDKLVKALADLRANQARLDKLLGKKDE